ncbi:MAG: hypothetical protein J3K34DRAFT_408626, partial [Monoraphidium minutum]
APAAPPHAAGPAAGPAAHPRRRHSCPPVRSGDDGQQGWQMPQLPGPPPPPGVLLGRIFRDLLNGFTGGKYSERLAAGWRGRRQPAPPSTSTLRVRLSVALRRFSVSVRALCQTPEFTVEPGLGIDAFTFGPTLSASATPLDLALVGSVSGEAALTPSAAVSSSTSVSGPDSSLTLTAPEEP